jgi:hypothetical protein
MIGPSTAVATVSALLAVLSLQGFRSQSDDLAWSSTSWTGAAPLIILAAVIVIFRLEIAHSGRGRRRLASHKPLPIPVKVGADEIELDFEPTGLT